MKENLDKFKPLLHTCPVTTTTQLLLISIIELFNLITLSPFLVSKDQI